MAAQLNQAGRVVTLVAVSQGQVLVSNAGDPTWSTTTNTTGDDPPLNFSGVIFSTTAFQKMWFADGINYVGYDPHINTVFRWTATAGELPQDENGGKPRLICTWRGRIVLSGLLLDPQNWFMSAVGDAFDWDYSPLSTSPTQAIAGNNAPQGQIGDVVTALLPYTDDILVFGGDHTIYMMRGDPMAGGQIDLISDAIGIAYGMAWTKDPFGNIYFFSNRTGVYTLVPGQAPQRISQGIEQRLQLVDTGTNSIRMIWDDRFQGVHIFVTPLEEPKPSDHFFYEVRTGGWFVDRFANVNHNPSCCCVFDGNSPNDRQALIGSWDGYVRAINPDALDDDGWPIESEVVIGPLTTKDLDEVICKDLQAVLGETSSDVNFDIHLGPTAERALNADPVASGKWHSGRNYSQLIRRSGHAIFVRITSNKPWALESIRLRVATLGRIRQRGR